MGKHHSDNHLLQNNGISVKKNYCDTCMVYIPPQCFHHPIYDNFMKCLNHNFPWVGKSIELCNYYSCFMYVKKIVVPDHVIVWKAMSKTLASIVLI